MRLTIMMTTGTISMASPAVEILIPPEHSSTRSDHLFVVGTSSAPVVELRLNGAPMDTVEVEDSVFHFLVQFGYGLNEIEVVASGDDVPGDGLFSSSVEVLSEPYKVGKYKNLYFPFIFHGNEPRMECVNCHQADEVTANGAQKIVSCLSCHTNIKVQFTGHDDFNNNNCFNCHQVGQNLTSSAIEDNPANNPCYTCHADKSREFSQDYIHGPVAGGSCHVCHDPHGSEYEKSLREPVQILCFSCHGEVEKELTRPVIHSPFGQVQCVKCHDPHSTNNRWILQKKSEELCLNCHKGDYDLKWHRHPYNVKPRKPLHAPLKLTDKGRLECLSCHNPHATDSVHLLRTEQKFTCKGCHSNLL